MKRLFRRLFEWLGWLKKEQPTEATEPQVDWNEVDEAPIFQETHYGEVNAEPVEEVLNSRDEETPPRLIRLPKDANDIQRLTRYNNPKTVYRNSKGRFASLK